MIHDQALACERYSDMLLTKGHMLQGKIQLENALRLYKDWEATAKIKALKTKLLRLKDHK